VSVDRLSYLRAADRWTVVSLGACVLVEGCHWHLFLAGPGRHAVGWPIMAAGSCCAAIGSWWHIKATVMTAAGLLPRRRVPSIGLILLFFGWLVQFSAGVMANFGWCVLGASSAIVTCR